MANTAQEQILAILGDPDAFMRFDPRTLQAESLSGTPVAAAERPAAVATPATASAGAGVFGPDVAAPAASPFAPQPAAMAAGADVREALFGEEQGELEQLARSVGRGLLGRVFGPEAMEAIEPASGALQPEVIPTERGGFLLANPRTGRAVVGRAPGARAPAGIELVNLVDMTLPEDQRRPIGMTETEAAARMARFPNRFAVVGRGGDGITVNVDTGERLTTSRQSEIQKEIEQSEFLLQQMGMVASQFQPGFQTVLGPGGSVQQFFLRLGDQLAPGLLDNEDRNLLANVTTFQQGAFAVVNAFIKQITGAQMSEPEARRIRRQLPDPDTMVDVEYMTRLENTAASVALGLLRKRELLRQGFDLEKIGTGEQLQTLVGLRQQILTDYNDVLFTSYNEALAAGMPEERAEVAANIAADQFLKNQYMGISIAALDRLTPTDLTPTAEDFRGAQ